MKNTEEQRAYRCFILVHFSFSLGCKTRPSAQCTMAWHHIDELWPLSCWSKKRKGRKEEEETDRLVCCSNTFIILAHVELDGNNLYQVHSNQINSVVEPFSLFFLLLLLLMLMLLSTKLQECKKAILLQSRRAEEKHIDWHKKCLSERERDDLSEGSSRKSLQILWPRWRREYFQLTITSCDQLHWLACNEVN